MASSKVELSDPGLKHSTILGTGDPDPIEKKLKKNNKKKWVEVSWEPTSARNDQKMQIVLYMSHIMIIYVLVVELKNFLKELTNFLKESNFVFFFLVYALWYGFTGVAHKDRNKSIAKKTHDFYRKHDQDEFELKSYTRPFSCDGCNEDGFGPRYRSDRCGSELHVECKSPEPTISHKLFQGSTFKFRRHSKRHGGLCDACGRNINGNFYRCKAKDLNLHPYCSKLEGELRMGKTDFTLRNKVLKKCAWCKKKALSSAKTGVPGWSYVSTCNKDHFHVSCITKLVHQAWKEGAIDKIDDTGKALEAMDWKPLARSNRKDGSGGSVNKLLKIVKIIVLPIVATLWGDPTPLVVALGAALFNN